MRKSSVRIERLPERNTVENINETRAAVIKISARDAIAQIADDKIGMKIKFARDSLVVSSLL